MKNIPKKRLSIRSEVIVDLSRVTGGYPAGTDLCSDSYCVTQLGPCRTHSECFTRGLCQNP